MSLSIQNFRSPLYIKSSTEKYSENYSQNLIFYYIVLQMTFKISQLMQIIQIVWRKPYYCPHVPISLYKNKTKTNKFCL